jgi:hypothetical protein
VGDRAHLMTRAHERYDPTRRTEVIGTRLRNAIGGAPSEPDPD